MNNLNEQKYYLKSAHDWKKDPATNKQLEYILEMHEFSEFPLPPFEGTTKGEAAEYINKYTK